jgi:excinuclease ABC subunit C
MVARVTRIEAVTCDSPHEAALLERNLLEASLPPWNRTPGGQENLVYIRMDKEPRAPGLTVDHLRRPAANVQYSGPYLTAGRHTGWLEGLRAAQRRTRRCSGRTLLKPAGPASPARVQESLALAWC